MGSYLKIAMHRNHIMVVEKEINISGASYMLTKDLNKIKSEIVYRLMKNPPQIKDESFEIITSESAENLR